MCSEEEETQDSNVVAFINSYAVYSEQDTTMNQTQDNMDDGAFFTTNAGDCPVNTYHDKTRDHVIGHVIFNQFGTFKRSRTRNIEGTITQKNLVQSLCSTIPGQNSPLLQPEAMLFPRNFYISANNDKCSILGSRPLFLMNLRRQNYVFSSTI